MEASTFYDIEAVAAPPRVGCRGGLMMTTELTQLTMFARHRGALAGGGGSLGSWPFDCYHDQKRGVPGPGFGVPSGAFSIDCLLTGRRGVDETGLQQLRPSIDNLNLLRVGKLSRTTDIDGQ